VLAGDVAVATAPESLAVDGDVVEGVGVDACPDPTGERGLESCGVEAPEDLVADLRAAFAAAGVGMRVGAGGA